VTALHRDGHEIPVELSIGAMRHDGAYYATAFLHDVTERVQYEQQIAASEARFKQLARIDTLTGIANRLVFEEVLQQAIVRARRNRKRWRWPIWTSTTSRRLTTRWPRRRRRRTEGICRAAGGQRARLGHGGAAGRR
jgi:PAS domain-containing protein